MAQLDTRLALLPAQYVAQQGDQINDAFNTYYKSSANARQNALLDLQNQEAENSNALFELQRANAQQQNQMGKIKLDRELGADLYKKAATLKAMTPEQRAIQLEQWTPELKERAGMTDAMIAGGLDDGELDYLMNGLSQYAPAPAEAKVGRFRTFEAEDGATYRFDSATGNTEVIRDAQEPDISILPPRLQELVKGQHREIQMNAIKSYTNSDKFLDRVDAESKQNNKDQSTLAKSSAVIEQIDEALQNTNAFTVGWGGLLSMVPGTDARDLKTTLDTIQANIGFDELQEMRDNSPTGGALGNVTERELNRLESTIDSLDQLQSEPSMRNALNEVRESYSLVKGIINGSITAPQTEEDFAELESGAIYIDPDDGKAYRKP